MVAKSFGMPRAKVANWVGADGRGPLEGTGDDILHLAGAPGLVKGRFTPDTPPARRLATPPRSLPPGVGCRRQPHRLTVRVSDAQLIADFRHKPVADLIVYSDRGCQHSRRDFDDTLKAWGIIVRCRTRTTAGTTRHRAAVGMSGNDLHPFRRVATDDLPRMKRSARWTWTGSPWTTRRDGLRRQAVPAWRRSTNAGGRHGAKQPPAYQTVRSYAQRKLTTASPH